MKQYAGTVTLGSNDPQKSWLNVRTGPSEKYAIMKLGGQDFRLAPGMPVSIEQEFGGWGKLTTAAGWTGWVSLNYIKK